MAMAGAEEALRRADEAMGRSDIDASVAHLAAAVRAFTSSGEPCRAAMASVRLGDVYANALGNLTAARAWFARATRLVEDRPPCIEQGWVAVAALGCEVDDPEELLARSELALDRARRFDDVNLETKALADAGLAHVQAGRLSEGMALLDEAMALACGPADDLEAAGKSVCSFFTACYYAADFARAESWASLLRRQGLIGVGPVIPVFLSSHCDSVQATLLVELGRWSDAERILLRAITLFETVLAVPSWHPAIALADLRIRQGRLEEAEGLLLGKEQHVEAMLPSARLQLGRGDHAVAREMARRGLRAMGDDRLRAIELLAVLVEAELAAGEIDAARAAAAELTTRLDGLDVVGLQARGAAARARVAMAGGALVSAVASLEEALSHLGEGHPWRRACLLLDLAALRHRCGDHPGAVVDARTASNLVDRLDVVLDPDRAAVLARLCSADRSGPPRSSAAPPSAELRRARTGWEAIHEGTCVRVRDSKGVRYLAELIARPGVEHHVLDLVDAVEGVVSGAPDRRRLGDAGAMSDRRAREDYRHRLMALQDEISESLARGSLEQAETQQHEHDALVRQLAHDFGLGGRSRPAASAAERARLNVTRALRTAIASISDALPDAGAALDRQVRTGRYCLYDAGGAGADTVHDLRWIVQS